MTDLLLEEFLRRDATRRAAIAARWRLYDDGPGKPLKVAPAKNGKPAVDDNVTPNLAGLFVDRGVSFLVGTPPSFTLDTPDDDDNGLESDDADAIDEGGVKVSPEEDWLDDVWKFNRAKTLLHKWALNGGVAGDAFLRIVIPERPVVDAGSGKIVPRLVNLDPANVALRWDQDDIDRLVGYVLEWAIVDEAGRPATRRQTIALSDDERTWEVVDYISKSASPFVPMGDPVEWPWPFSPIIHAQNLPRPNAVYGKSDLEGGVDALNASLARVISNLARIVRFHAHPKTWASGIGTAELAQVVVDPEGIVGLPHPEAQLHNLEMSSDLTGALAVFGKIKALLHEVGRNPEIDPEKLEGVGSMSGLAMRILYGPLLELTDTKHGTYGDALEEVNRRLLAVAGWQDYDPTLTVQVGWHDALPADQMAEAQTAQAKQELGVSKHTLLEELGYDPDIEAERREDEAAAAIDNVRTAFDRGNPSLTGDDAPAADGGNAGDGA